MERREADPKGEDDGDGRAPRAVRIDRSDDVATLLTDARPTRIQVVSPSLESLGTVDLLEPIPFGHKVALRDLAAGASVGKYGAEIGVATRPIRRGEHVHVHNLASRRRG